ncbi:DUF4270 family protein [Roseivirga pacifica]|uniref:DUF4270 family protein n=1 Tax=Roseivirga pacifica TaxID=1267423 RepID=UPI003BAC6A9E
MKLFLKACALLAVLCIYACEQPIGIAPDGALDDVFDINVLDTFSIKTYTEIEDSIVTSSPARFLIGAASFDQTGTVYAQSFLNLRPASLLELDEDMKFDSLYLYLYFNEALTLEEEVRDYTVHLIKPVNTEELEVEYYNFDSMPFIEEPVGTFTYSPTMEKGDSIPVKISGSVGETLFALALQGEVYSGNSNFLNQFTGFAIRPGDDNTDQVISLLNTSYSSENEVAGTVTKLRMYYHEEVDYSSSEYFDFFNSSNYVSFNSITASLEGTSLAGLASGARFSSELTGNISYVKAGVGIYSRIELPYVEKLNELSKNYLFNSAILEVSPLRGTYSQSMPLPDSLAVFLTNELETTGNFDYNDSGAEQYFIYSGLSYDEELGEQAVYSFDVTDLIHAQLADNGAHEFSMILTPPTSTVLSSFEQVQLPNSSHEQAGVKLKLYMTKVLTDYE